MVEFEFKPALCLDLDGTIRYSKSGEFIDRPSDVVVYDDVEEKLWEYRDNGYLIFGISNQGGVAFGYRTRELDHAILAETIRQFEENPFYIVKTSYHHPDGDVEPYCHRSMFRKPQTGMLAFCEVSAWRNGIVVDWDNSLFVGDRPEDKECAEKADIEFVSANEFFGRSESD